MVEAPPDEDDDDENEEEDKGDDDDDDKGEIIGENHTLVCYDGVKYIIYTIVKHLFFTTTTLKTRHM